MDWMQSLLSDLRELAQNNLVDWVLTGFITFFATRSATKDFYDKNKRKVAHDIMNKNLRDMLELDSSQQLPPDAKVIFVEYAGRCCRLTKEGRAEMKCRFLEKIRKTVLSVGADVSDVSSYRPINYGVLGIANMYKRPMLYDFACGELTRYENNQLIRMNTVKKEDGYYYYVKSSEKEYRLSSVDSSRGTMIALPICKSEKLYGGVTFDMASGNAVYQRILETDSKEEKERKANANRKLMTVALNTANSLFTAYFNKKGEE